MRNIFAISLLVIFFGCQPATQQEEPQTHTQKDTVKADTLTLATTSSPVKPLRALPASFVLDSIIREDTSANYSVTLFFPRSINDEALNTSVKQFVEYRMNLEKPKEKTDERFDLWISEIKNSGGLINFLFKEQSFTEGAAHYNSSTSALNYNAVQKKIVTFTDIFKFSKKNSKRSFCNKINGFANQTDASDGYNDGLKPEEINKDLNYVVANGQLTIYPNYCCANEGTTFTIDLPSIKDYINPTLEKKYGLHQP